MKRTIYEWAALAAVVLTTACAAATPTGTASSGAVAVTGFGFTVRDVDAAAKFFTEVLGAQVEARKSASGPELAALTGLDSPSAEAIVVRVGDERVTLTAFSRTGQPVASDAVSNDLDFQHLALVVGDMDAAHRRVTEASVTAVSRGGPQRIPDSNVAAAGIRAFYFRDAEGHPLELIWFPDDKGEARWHQRDGALVLGIDHSAIAVFSTDAGLEFYRGLLGLRVAGESLNEGVEQERLSGVDGARVRITGLRAGAGPGVEFLEYKNPGPGHPRPDGSTPRDLFHWETTIEVSDLTATQKRLVDAGVPIVSTRIAACDLCAVGRRALLVRDPDGHAVRLIER